jgi:hypothetical protein
LGAALHRILHRFVDRYIDQFPDGFGEVGLRHHEVMLHSDLGGVAEPGGDDVNGVFPDKLGLS